MNNLFYNLPENLQDKIIRMNPHPLKEIFEKEMSYEVDCLNYKGGCSNNLWYIVMSSNAWYNCFTNYSDDDSDSFSEPDYPGDDDSMSIFFE